MYADYHAVMTVAGRSLIAFLFLFQAFSAIGRFDFHLTRFQALDVPLPRFVLACGLAMMLAGGAMVLLGILAAVGSGILIVFTLAATLLFQNFWSITDPGRRREKRTSFLYNLAIIGGLLLVMAG